MGLTISGTFRRLFCKNSMLFWMIGPPDAGKTTIIYKLKLGEIITTIPTMGNPMETFEYKNISITICDSGGGDKIRRHCWHFIQETEGIIFVFDSSNIYGITEAEEKLHRLLSEDHLKESVVLILANKQDLANSMSTAELT